MRKIAINKEAASVLLPGSRGENDDLRVFSNLPARALQGAVTKSQGKELRFIIPDDGKMWVWDSYAGWIHGQVMEEMGYDEAICGYIKQEKDGLQVSWYHNIQDAWGSDQGPAYPQKSPIFKRTFADPSIALSSRPSADYGYSQPWEDVRGKEYLDPADVRQFA